MSEDEIPDPDRAAILARRRRFIALAISGLATGGCKHQSPEPCLSIALPEEGEGEGVPNASGPFIEDPGVPVDSGETEGEPGGEPPPTNPHPCLRVQPSPQACLKTRPAPHPCLMIMNNGGT